MSKRSELSKPGYSDRKAARKRLRAIIGWSTRFGDLTPEQRQEAERRASEPLLRTSLDSLARGLSPDPANAHPPQPKAITLAFDGRLREPIAKGQRSSTVRKLSSHTARYKVGTRVRLEAPRGQSVGETTITAVDPSPRLSSAELDGLRRIYGSRYNGPWVRLRFDPLA